MENDLTSVLNLNNDKDEPIFNNSEYHDIDGMADFLKINKGKLSILSMNIQSISAKIDKLKPILNDLYHKNNLAFSIILFVFRSPGWQTILI
jgi:hypothetical protein